MYTVSLHDALPISSSNPWRRPPSPTSSGAPAAAPSRSSPWCVRPGASTPIARPWCCARQGEDLRSEEHTSELQSRLHLVCRLLLDKKKTAANTQRAWLSVPILSLAVHDDHRDVHCLPTRRSSDLVVEPLAPAAEPDVIWGTGRSTEQVLTLVREARREHPDRPALVLRASG